MERNDVVGVEAKAKRLAEDVARAAELLLPQGVADHRRVLARWVRRLRPGSDLGPDAEDVEVAAAVRDNFRAPRNHPRPNDNDSVT